MSLLRRAFEQRDITHSATAPMGAGITVPSNADAPASTAGVPVNDRSALGLTAFYACVRLLADTIASLPWDSYRRSDGDNVRTAVSPTPSLLGRPSALMTTFEWKHAAMVSLCTRGNFYGLVTQRDKLEYPTDITPLNPDAVRIDRDPSTGAKQIWLRDGTRVDPAELFHVRAFTLPGNDVGLSPIQMARASLGLGLAAQEYGAKWFRDGASPSSVLQTEQDLDDDEVRRVQRSWISSHGGRRRPAVLSGGFKWQSVQITPEESQFLQTRQYQGVEVAQLMGVPPHMIGIVDKSTSWGTGIEQQSIGFVTYTLRSWLTRLESSLSDMLPRGQFVKFNVDGLLRGDTTSRYEAYQTALDSGWRSPDEVRALEDLPPIPGGAGQGFRQPLNFGPLGAVPTPTTSPAARQQEDADATTA